MTTIRQARATAGIHALHMRSIHVLLLILGVVMIVILKLLVAAPVWFHVDENYYLNISQNFMDRGQLTPYMWRLDNDTNIIAGSGTGYGIYLLVTWMSVVGNTLVNGRILMILVGLVNAGVMYFVARKWWGSEGAGATAFVFTLVSTSPFYSLVVRMDAPGMLAYSIVLLLHIHAVRDQKRWFHFATGAALVIAAEFHILAILYIVALSAWYLLEYIGEFARKRRLVLDVALIYFVVGGLVAGLVYIGLHILPDPAAYFAIPSDFHQSMSVFVEIVRYTRFMLLRPVEFLLLFFTILTALFRRRPEDRHYVVLIVVWMIALSGIGIRYYTHYTAHIWPLLAIGTAGFIARGVKANGDMHVWRTRFGLCLAAAALLFNLGVHVFRVYPFEVSRTIVEKPNMTFVRETIPDDTVIMTDAWDFYYLRNFLNFMSYRDTDEQAVMQRGETMLDYWRREQPLVIIGNYRSEDPLLDQYMSEEHFREVRPQLWVAASLLEELSIDNAETT